MRNIDEIESEELGHRAVALANEVVDGNPDLQYDVREALYRRLYKKVGPQAYTFSPRVSTIWFDFKANPKLKLAAILLSLSQDQHYPCEKEWEDRLVVSGRVLDHWEPKEVDAALMTLLSNVFYAKIVGKDFRSADHYISKIIKSTVKDEDAFPVPVNAGRLRKQGFVPDSRGLEKHAKWLSLFRRNNG